MFQRKCPKWGGGQNVKVQNSHNKKRHFYKKRKKSRKVIKFKLNLEKYEIGL